ncbi:amino acid ABC transporter ATP-binding protein [Tetragenococcus halophilus]|uniref:Glutamine ABC transporter ATP-binding protein n=1 Tax=Tetragenococcus halophilus (strain DSM 20338 / JCM 20259 / NCIMB 9735 / NBRC 12172) TaxID=945021 RepID=A0AAN1SHM0_TETHN|nr:amino acid ABC transporter ATP-binding protein [Tetragenococcus halophilus]MCO7025536.1 amino acid ABC transporter ATP-binding protein [Tetragenococcus halophilus]NWN99529.1 amino acid ABC transporter ATP-binding protein [Tetragenococcus halophilus]RQD32705.1 amino acid ABC transporter ATP-binding protein [Tetragenococcus halophilus subsp. halophilus DSM 20339]WJS80997.1 amino acid ABC transporter ATP-binding protein [Tetragenococcus halophilus]BAK94649.1 putative glutamine ABC transporter 
MSMIEFKNVEKYFGNFHALKNINLTFEKGEVVVVIGPSGSGKSTLLRTINGLEMITSGNLLINDQDIRSKKTKLTEIRKNIGMVFQHFNLYPNKTVLENITLAPTKVLNKSEKDAGDTAESLLDRVGMLDKKDSYPSTLSGGQQQRVAIARGLAMQPEMLLFDEPTSALDPEMIGDVLDVMKKIAHEGMSMIVVTHEMNFAREVADRVIFMTDGEVLEDSHDVESFFKKPKEVRAQQFISKVVNH